MKKPLVAMLIISVAFFFFLLGSSVYRKTRGIKANKKFYKNYMGKESLAFTFSHMGEITGCRGCADIVDLKITPSILPYGFIEVNNCNNGVLCIRDSRVPDWKINKHVLVMGDFTIPHKDYQVCFELVTDKSGQISVQESYGNYASDEVPLLDETLYIPGKFDGQEFVLSYRKVINPEKKKQGSLEPSEMGRMIRQEKAKREKYRMKMLDDIKGGLWKDQK